MSAQWECDCCGQVSEQRDLMSGWASVVIHAATRLEPPATQHLCPDCVAAYQRDWKLRQKEAHG